ncbi:hypothetical protein ACIBJI_40030 [Nocardia sp. NPDC050408]|uniref:hypothetical protein n=1 Tax=Nocardia sp. NPDC050408 TaxID=3364319 RepID=UPI0037B1796B
MTAGGIDALQVAREHLVAVSRTGDDLTADQRLQLGLLAAQVAIAERLDDQAGSPQSHRRGVPDSPNFGRI